MNYNVTFQKTLIFHKEFQASSFSIHLQTLIVNVLQLKHWLFLPFALNPDK